MKLSCGHRYLIVNRGDFFSFPTIEKARAAANGDHRWFVDSGEMRDPARYIVDLGTPGADGRYHYDSATMVALEVVRKRIRRPVVEDATGDARAFLQVERSGFGMSAFTVHSATEFTADDNCVYRASAVLKYVDRTDAHFVEVRVDTTSFVLTDRHHRVPLELLDEYLRVIRATIATCRFRLNKDPNDMPDFESTLRSVIGETP